MLLTRTARVSGNELKTHTEAFQAGFRPDMRKLDEGRQLEIRTSRKPCATIRLGGTSVTALSTAKIIVPSESAPAKGRHSIKVCPSAFASLDAANDFQTYFEHIWRSSGIIEEEALCMKPGEKVWDVRTLIVIHDDDGGLFDAMFTACYVSLSLIGFPFFDPATGQLYPSSQRRVHRIAFAAKPTAVTIGFMDDKTLVADPTLIEMQIMDRFVVFVLNEWNQQILIDAKMPGDIDAARELAIQIADQRRKIASDAIESGQNLLEQVGAPADFIGYTPSKFDIPKTKQTLDLKEFEVWEGETNGTFVVDFFKDIDVVPDNIAEELNFAGDVDWLTDSLA